jgi:TonB family protein
MVSEVFFIFCRPLDPGRRLGMALVASALLHALMFSSVSRYSVHGSVLTRLVSAPLSVRIERLPDSPEATPIVVSDKKVSLHQKRNAPQPVATTLPAAIEPFLPQPGVSVSDTLFLRPISSRASGIPLLASGEYRKISDLSERPEAVAISIPNYPRPAREQKVSGWVVVMLFVDEEGKVVDTAAVESSESFDDYAREVAEALRRSTFAPGKLAGRAVKTLTFAMVRFDSRALSGLETAKGSTAPVSIDRNEKR